MNILTLCAKISKTSVHAKNKRTFSRRMNENQIELAKVVGDARLTETGHFGQIEKGFAGEIVRAEKVVVHHHEVDHRTRRDFRRNSTENLDSI